MKIRGYLIRSEVRCEEKMESVSIHMREDFVEERREDECHENNGKSFICAMSEARRVLH